MADVDKCEHISCVTSDQVWVGDDNLILINTAGDILHRLTNISFELYSGGNQTITSEGELIYIDEDYNINKLSNDMKKKHHYYREKRHDMGTTLCVLVSI